MTIFSPYFPIFLSLSVSFFFSFLLPNLISFFKNAHHHHHFLHFPSFLGLHGGLGLVSAIRHVVVKKLTPPPPASSAAVTNADLSDVVGVAEPMVVDGLASCTESLGFESSDESRVDDPIERVGDFYWRSAEGRANWRRMRKEVRSFPPPLSSLNPKGQPTFFLRPVRKNGRLELTEVRIRRPDILRAWRHDGRLTLFLVPDDERILEDSEDDGEDESEQQQQQQQQEGEEEQQKGRREEEEEIAELEGEIGELEGKIGELEDKIEDAITEEKEEEKEEEEEEEKEEKEVGFGDQWKLGIGGNEGLRSCHEEVVNRHSRNVLPVRHYRDHRHRNHPLHVCGLGIA